MLAYPAGELVYGIQYSEQARVDHAVIDVPAVAAVYDQTGLAQHGQLLREVSLPVAQVRFHVADAALTPAQNVDDRQSRRVGKQLEQPGLRLVWAVGEGLLN
jgi:hypothetical protein